MTRSKALSCAAFAAQLLACPALLASPADLFGVGAESQSMAQTGVASGEHDHQSYTNPALLAGQRRQHVSLGYQSALFNTSYRGNELHSDQELVSASLLGLSLPLPFGGWLERRLALGLSVVSPRELVTRAALWFPERPQFPLLTSQAESLSLTTGVGVRINDGLNLGFAVRWLASMADSVLISGDEQGQTTTVVKEELVASRSPVIGASAAPLPWLRAGLVFRGVQRSDLDIRVRFAELGALELPDLNLSGTAQYDPATLDSELSWLAGAFQLNLGLRYRRWSAFDGFLRRTVDCPAGETKCGTAEPPAPGFSDTWSPRLGLSRRLSLTRHAEAELRVGALYEPTPVPEQRSDSNYWDNARLVLCAGYAVTVAGGGTPFSLELAVQHHRLVERSHQKSGAARESAGELAHVTTGGQLTLLALEIGVAF